MQMLVIQDKLSGRIQQGNMRSLKSLDHRHVDFTSNDYLGLARSTLLKNEINKEWNRIGFPLIGTGSTGSRLLTGHCDYSENLESQIASFHHAESCLLYSCGYMANIGLLSSIISESDYVLYDTHVHASVHDGMRLSKGNAIPFRHNDLNHLESRLKHYSKIGKCFVCIESLYSMNGSLAPIVPIARLTQHYEANLIIDEAHAIGVHGLGGRGFVYEYGVTEQVFATIVTFGKALGTHGAAVLGSTKLKQFLINFSRACIYTTALPLHCLAAIRCAYQLLPKLEKERTHLRKLIDHYRALTTNSTKTQIQSLQIPGNERVKSASEYLHLQGIDVRPIMNPTVKRGKEMLRVCLHSFNTTEQLNRLIHHIDEWKNLCAT